VASEASAIVGTRCTPIRSRRCTRERPVWGTATSLESDLQKRSLSRFGFILPPSPQFKTVCSRKSHRMGSPKTRPFRVTSHHHKPVGGRCRFQRDAPGAMQLLDDPEDTDDARRQALRAMRLHVKYGRQRRDSAGFASLFFLYRHNYEIRQTVGGSNPHW